MIWMIGCPLHGTIRIRGRGIAGLQGWYDVGFHQTPKDNRAYLRGRAHACCSWACFVHQCQRCAVAETSTPHMDALAAEGVILNRHYVHQMCTPSRCSFLSGRFPVHVQQQLTNPEDPSGGIPRNMTVVAAKMKAGGYTTAIVGK